MWGGKEVTVGERVKSALARCFQGYRGGGGVRSEKGLVKRGTCISSSRQEKHVVGASLPISASGLVW